MIKKFNEYAKTFDLTIKPIMSKYHHSFRVMEFACNIAKSLNLSEEDILLAKNCGLLHDIARFKQWTLYNTYTDLKSIDHGDEGYNILNEYFFDENTLDRNIILLTTKYHNKYELPNLDYKTDLFCKIIRDADKLDILKEQYLEIKDNEIIINKELLEDIKNDKICRNELVKTSTDGMLRALSWINDLNFKYSYDYLINNNIIENKLNLFSLYGETEEIKDLKKTIYDKIEKRKKYVR